MANLYFRTVADLSGLENLMASIRTLGVEAAQTQSILAGLGNIGSTAKLTASFQQTGIAAQSAMVRAVAAQNGLIVSAKAAAAEVRLEAQAFFQLQKAVGAAAFGTGGNTTLRGMIQQTQYLRSLTASYQAQLAGMQTQQATMMTAGGRAITAPMGMMGMAQLAQLNAGQMMTFNTAISGANLAQIRLMAMKAPLMGLSSQMINLGKNAQFVGRNLSTMLTLPMLLGIKKAVSLFMSVNKEITRINKVAGQADFKKYGDNIQAGIGSIVKTFGMSQQSAAKLTGDVVSMGYAIRGTSSEAYRLSEAIAFTSTLGDIGLSTSRDFFRTMLKVFTQGEPGVKNFNDQLLATNFIIDQLNQIENKTVININQLAEAMPKAAGAAKLFGLNAAQLASVITGVYDKGIQLDTAATGLNFIFTRILNPTKQAADRFDKAFGTGALSGIQQLGSGMEKLIALADRYQELATRGASDKKANFTAVAQVFGELIQRRQVKTFVPMVNSILIGTRQIKDALATIPGAAESLKMDGIDLGKARLNDLREAMTEYRDELLKSQYLTEGFGRSIVASSAFTEINAEKLADLAEKFRNLSMTEIQIRLQSPETQFQIMSQTFKMVGAEIGKSLVPPLLKLMHVLLNFFEKIGNMSSGMKAAFGGILIGLALLGPAIYLVSSLATVFGVLSKAVFSLMPGLRFLTVEELNLLAANNALDGNVAVLGNRYIWLKSKQEYYNATNIKTLSSVEQVDAAMRNADLQKVKSANATKLLAEADAQSNLAAQKNAEAAIAARTFAAKQAELASLEEAAGVALVNEALAENAIFELKAAQQTKYNALMKNFNYQNDLRILALSDLNNKADEASIRVKDALAVKNQGLIDQGLLEMRIQARRVPLMQSITDVEARLSAERVNLATLETQAKNALIDEAYNYNKLVDAKKIQDEKLLTLALLEEEHKRAMAAEAAITQEELSRVRIYPSGNMHQGQLREVGERSAIRQEEITQEFEAAKARTQMELTESNKRVGYAQREVNRKIASQEQYQMHIAASNNRIAALDAELAAEQDALRVADRGFTAERKLLRKELEAAEAEYTAAVAAETKARERLEAENFKYDMFASQQQEKRTALKIAAENELTAAEARRIALEEKSSAIRVKIAQTEAALDAEKVAGAEAAAMAETAAAKATILRIGALYGLDEQQVLDIASTNGLSLATDKLTEAEELQTLSTEAAVAALREKLLATNLLSAAQADLLISDLALAESQAATVPAGAGGMAAGFKRIGKGLGGGIKKMGSMIIPGLGSGAGAGAGAAAVAGEAGGAIAGGATLLGPFLIIAAAIAAIVAAVILLKRHWKDVSEGMKNGLKSLKGAWDEIKKAFSSIVDIFAKNTKAVGGMAEQGSKTGNVWNSIGKILGGIITIFAKIILVVSIVMKVLKPFWKTFSDVMGSIIGVVVNVIQIIGAALSGDWDRVWTYAWRAVIYAMKAIVKIVDWGAFGVVKILGKALGLLGISFGKTLENFGIGNTLNKQLDKWLKGSMGKKKVTYKVGVEAEMSRDSKAALTDPLQNLASNLDQTSGGGAGGKAGSAFNDFLQKLKAKLDDFISKLKDQVSQEIDAVWSQRLKIYDDQIKAIDALEKKEEELLATQQYIESRRDALNKRALDRDNYRRNRALAIYEGRIDDARMMDMEFSQSDQSNAKSIRDIETNRARDLLKKSRDLQRQRIETEKKAAEDRKAIEEKALKDQIDLITKYTPKTDAEWRAMVDQINATLSNYGMPAIAATWQNGLAIFQQSIAEIAADVKNDNFWNGSWIDSSIQGWLEVIGGQNYIDAMFEIGRAQGSAMGSGQSAGLADTGPQDTNGDGVPDAGDFAKATDETKGSKGAEAAANKSTMTPWGKMPTTDKGLIGFYQRQLNMWTAAGSNPAMLKELLKDKNLEKYLKDRGVYPFYKRILDADKNTAGGLTAENVQAAQEASKKQPSPAAAQLFTTAYNNALEQNRVNAQNEQTKNKYRRILHGGVFNKKELKLRKQMLDQIGTEVNGKKLTEEDVINQFALGSGEMGTGAQPPVLSSPKDQRKDELKKLRTQLRLNRKIVKDIIAGRPSPGGGILKGRDKNKALISYYDQEKQLVNQINDIAPLVGEKTTQTSTEKRMSTATKKTEGGNKEVLGGLKKAWDWFIGDVESGTKKKADVWKLIFGDMKTKELSKGWDKFIEGVKNAINPTRIYDKKMEDKANKTGKELVDGIAAGTNDETAKKKIGDNLKSAVDSAHDAVITANEIHSPSRRFGRNVGQPITLGIAAGILNEKVVAALAVAFETLLAPHLNQTRTATLKLRWVIESGGLASGIQTIVNNALNNLTVQPELVQNVNGFLSNLWKAYKQIARMIDGILAQNGSDKFIGPIERRGGLIAPALAQGGIVRRRPGGIMANIGEGRYDEAVIPLTSGLKSFANSFQPSRSSIGSYEASMRAAFTAALQDAGLGGDSSESGGINIYVDNFIGQPQWFESMMNEYGVKVAPNKQRSYGTMNRRVSSYQDNAYRTGKI